MVCNDDRHKQAARGPEVSPPGRGPRDEHGHEEQEEQGCCQQIGNFVTKLQQVPLNLPDQRAQATTITPITSDTYFASRT